MAKNIENITDYRKGNSFISGDFLLYAGSNVTCATAESIILSIPSIPQFISEELAPNPPIVTDIYGCTDPAATNYNPYATANDGTCFYGITGCTDPAAENYNPNANIPTPCNFIGTLDAYIGFTSATGAYDEYHIIHDLKYTNDIMTLDYSNGFDDKFSYNGTAFLDIGGNTKGQPASGSYNGFDYTGISTPGNRPRSAVMTNPWGTGSIFYIPGVTFRNNIKEEAHNFSVEYSFTITPDVNGSAIVADGICFVVQAVNYGVGGGGGSIGYGGLVNSFAVKHDTFYNISPEIEESISLTPYGYLNKEQFSNYVGIVQNGDIFGNGDSYVSCSTLPGINGNFVYSDGHRTYVWVDYINGSWYVYLSKTNSKPSTPLINGYYMPLVGNIFTDQPIIVPNDNISNIIVDSIGTLRTSATRPNDNIFSIIVDSGGTLNTTVINPSFYISNIIVDRGGYFNII